MYISICQSISTDLTTYQQMVKPRLHSAQVALNITAAQLVGKLGKWHVHSRSRNEKDRT